MKKILFLTVLYSLIMMGCKKPYEEKAIGPPIYSPEKIREVLNGKWILRKASQVDEKSLTKETIDITDFYIQESGSQLPNVEFNTSAGTFTSDTAGVAIRYFGTGGTWSFDNENYPTKITLVSDVSSITIDIGSNLLIPSGYLVFKEQKVCGSETTMTFDLEFIKQ